MAEGTRLPHGWGPIPHGPTMNLGFRDCRLESRLQSQPARWGVCLPEKAPASGQIHG